MMSKKLTVLAVIICLIFNFVFFVPRTHAFLDGLWGWIVAANTGFTAGSTTSVAVKEYALDTIARGIARSLMNAAVSGLIDKIQTGGRDGGPAFVQNWRNFQTGAEYRGENVFRAILSNTNLCDSIDKGVKGLFGANKKISTSGQNTRSGNFDPFALRANCTLPSDFNINDYRNNFSGNGGWEAFSRILDPQNNFYGVLFMSLNEADKQRSLEVSGDINEALAGSGYTSIRDSCTGSGAGAKCTFLGKVVTPGDLLGKSAASTIDQELAWLVSSDEISEVIIDITSALTNRVANLARSKPSQDYSSAPAADTSSSQEYLACINACGTGKDLTCQNNCSKKYGINSPSISCQGPPEECPATGEEGSGDNPSPTPNQGIPPAPNKIGIIQAVANEHPDYLASSCQDAAGGSWQFMDEVVKRLHEADPKFGYNGKRGNINDPSKDAISYYYGDGQPENGSYFVYIIDIISGHCGPSPSPAWQDVTAETIAGGTTGAYLFPR